MQEKKDKYFTGKQVALIYCAMRLSEYMKEQLIGRGVQAKFARKAKISTGTVSKWAQGDMDRAPNFENCIRIANYFGLAPLEVFEMAERPEFADLFKELFPHYERIPAPVVASPCLENNPDHISYHTMLEDILHGTRHDANFWRDGIIANLKAMRLAALSGDSTPKGDHGPHPVLGNVRNADRLTYKDPESKRGGK